MDDYDNEHDHDSNASSDDQEHDQEQQDDNMTMEDGDDMEVDEDDAFNEEDEDQDEDDNGGDGDQDGDQDQDQDQEQDQDGEQDGDQDQDQEQDQEQEGDQEDDTTTRVDRPSHSKSNSIDTPLTPKFRPRVRPEAITARLYDIVPTMAAPQATSINAIAITPDLRYWMTGGSDGYIRKYDGPGTINGKQLLTVAQRHPFVDSVTKAGILMSYWENLEPAPPNPRGGASDADRVLSPVYSLAVHREALWLLAGLESGGINLHSVRHDEGKTIHVMQEHKNAVSVLQLAPDEKTVLSGSWDKNILDWDLNTGKSIRDFRGSGGQISALEPRPLSGAPVPAEAAEENFQNDTIRPSTRTNGFFSSGPDSGIPNGGAVPNGDSMADGEESDHESLFGSPAGSLFGDGNNNMGADNPFGGDNDNDGYSHAMLEPLDDAPHADGDVTMGGDVATGDTSHQTTDHTTTDAAPSITQDPAQTQAEQPSASDAASNHLKPQDAPQADPPRPSTAQTDGDSKQPSIHSPTLVFNNPAPAQFDPTQTSDSTFFSAAMDGTIRIWDRRVPAPLARIGTRPGVPPWCMGACWSPDGNTIYAGRRNGTVEEFNIHKATSNWQPERTLKFPAGSGAVSAVRTMVNGRHLVCASHDILRLYDLRDNRAFKHGAVPFLIVPGPPRAGVISQMYVDPTSRYMLTAAGTRGWEGSSTEVLIGYEIGCVND